MSFSLQGSQVSLTTSSPATPKHLVRVGNQDAVVYWTSATELSVRYEPAGAWTNASSPSTSTVTGFTLVGSPRTFRDVNDSTYKWVIWPTMASNDLVFHLVRLSGLDVVFYEATYANAIDGTETVQVLAPMEEGIGMVLKDSDTGTFFFRHFTYPASGLSGVTADIELSVNPVTSNYGDGTFNETTNATVSRASLLSFQIETASQVRALFVTPSVVGDVVSLTTSANTTAGLPTASGFGRVTQLENSKVMVVLEDGGAQSVLTMASDATSISTAALTTTGSLSGVKIHPYSSNQTFVSLGGDTSVALINPSTGALVNEITGFVSGSTTLTTLSATPVVVGSNASALPITGIRVENALGVPSSMGDAAATVTRLGSIQNLPSASDLFYVEGNGGSDLLLYGVDTLPPIVNVATSYQNRFGYFFNTGGTIYDLTAMQLLPNGKIAVVGQSGSDLSMIDPAAGPSFTRLSIGAFTNCYGQIGLAPNGDLFFSDSGSLYRSTNGSGTPELVVQANGPSITAGVGGTCILPNGSAAFTFKESNVNQSYLFIWDGTNTTELDSGTLASAMNGGITALATLANGNLVFGVREANKIIYVDPSTPGGTLLGTVSTLETFGGPTAFFKYDTDKFLMSKYNTAVIDFDAVAEDTTSVSVSGESMGSTLSYGLCVVPNGDLFQISREFSRDSFYRAEPVP